MHHTDPSWALGRVSMPEGGQRVVGVGLCGSQEWESQLGALSRGHQALSWSSIGGPSSASHHPASGMGPERPQPLVQAQTHIL